jgi:hypothetical protein
MMSMIIMNDNDSNDNDNNDNNDNSNVIFLFLIDIYTNHSNILYLTISFKGNLIHY